MTIMVTYKQEGEVVKMLVYNFTNPNGAIPPKIYNSQLSRVSEFYANMKKYFEGALVETPDNENRIKW